MSKNYAYLYAIRDKLSCRYLIDRRSSFGDFESMVANGVYFNQQKSAEKRIKEMMQGYDDMDPQRMVYTGYTVYGGDGKPVPYTTNPAYVEQSKADGYIRIYAPLELEVIMLYIGEPSLDIVKFRSEGILP